MPRYAITEKAGPFVAAHRNTGVGTLLDLTEHQAEHELRLGTLVRVRDIAEAQPERSAPHAPQPQPERFGADMDRRRRPARQLEPSTPSEP